MKKIIPILACALLTASSGLAQQTNTPDAQKQGTDNEVQSAVWTGNFAGGQVMVPISKIAAIAQQKYLLDGQFFVYEVTIDVIGNTVTRIYYIEPLADTASGSTNIGAAAYGRAKELVGIAQNRTGTSGVDINTIVSKNYPATTHSHTIEFRVATLDELNAVYKSIATAFQRGKGRVYTAASK